MAAATAWFWCAVVRRNRVFVGFCGLGGVFVGKPLVCVGFFLMGMDRIRLSGTQELVITPAARLVWFSVVLRGPSR